MNEQGRTLPELLIASGILLLLTAACASALRASMQYHQRIQEQSRIEEDLLKTVGSLSKELGESSILGTVWQATPPALTFPTPRNDNGTLLIDHAAGNRIRWQTLLSYRLEGDQGLLKRYIDRLPSPEVAPPHPLHLTPPRDDLYFAVPGREYRTVASGVTNFEARPLKVENNTVSKLAPSDFAKANLFQVFLRIEQGGDRKYAVSTEVDIVPSN
ncbi:MAG: hypothetical protein WC314_19205 [Vulcanimicrobiota bacterium]